MKSQQLRRSASILFYCLLINAIHLMAQCDPDLPMSETCKDAIVLCSLDELNGYTCYNPSTIPSPCNPICHGEGIGNNTNWWAFMAKGGPVELELSVGGCTTSQGLQFGIWADCFCIEEVACIGIPCIPPSSNARIYAELKPCKIYYLWVDGCSGDICDFTLKTTNGGAPILDSIPNINDETDKIIDNICIGACDIRFFLSLQADGCEAFYIWTLDNNKVGGNGKEVLLDFPDEGEFTLCVTEYAGDPNFNTICSFVGPKCATVRVAELQDTFYGPLRQLCYVQTLPNGYTWHDQKITSSGVYTAHFSINCCEYDSIVQFSILDQPKKPVEVFFISCDNEPYVDVTGKSHPVCKDQYIIPLPDDSNPFGCDSSILLKSVGVSLKHGWQISRLANQVELNPNISLSNVCNIGEAYVFTYNWYKKSDVLKTTIGTTERLIVNARNEEYCVDVKVKVQLGNINKVCSMTFCESMREEGPVLSDNCENAYVHCSLEELNGYVARNTSTVAGYCIPLCSLGGVGTNTSWWAFTGQGGDATIQLTIGDCLNSQGLEFGVWGDCYCSEEIACKSFPWILANTTEKIDFKFNPCKTYYLWINGISGDVCDFTLNTSVNAPSILNNLGHINNELDEVIGPLCASWCSTRFFVDPEPGACTPTYEWSIDGIKYFDNSNEFYPNFPKAGDFVICVSAYVGNKQNGSVCSITGPRCATIKIRPIEERHGALRRICQEEMLGEGFQWQSQIITKPGFYHETFADSDCCLYDSIVEFDYLDVPKSIQNIYFITCNNEPYVDILGNFYAPCINKLKISYPDSSNPFGCDSAIILTVVSANLNAQWQIKYNAATAEIKPNITLENNCYAGESYDFRYKWYRKDDPLKTRIASTENIIVDTVKDNYCIDVECTVHLGTSIKICTTTFCEYFNESGRPLAEYCDSVQVFCSLDELNGYSSSNYSTVPSHCDPLCWNGGKPYNTSWLGFTTRGGDVTIQLSVGECENDYGLQWGIWADCVCQTDIGCWSDPFTHEGFSNEISVNLKPCKTYYLWINGFAGDLCDFTIATSSQNEPNLSSLALINNDKDSIIGPFCQGACNVAFRIEPQPDNCIPFYTWTLDGIETGSNNNEVKLDFPSAGDFKLCVAASIGNPKSGSVCYQQGPRCATVKIRSSNLVFFGKRTLCFEDTQPDGYEWYSKRIFKSGVYQEHLIDSSCCGYDSIVEFTVLDMQGPPNDVYFVSCNNEPFIDPLGNVHFPCKDKIEIVLPGRTLPFACDSSIRLSIVDANLIPNWKYIHNSGKIDYLPNLALSNPCKLGESYEFEYTWYKANDPNKTVLSKDEHLLSDLIVESYCVDVRIKVRIDTAVFYCLKTFCETFDENLSLFSETCDSVTILCSLDELDGFTGYNWSLIPSPCNPLCSQGGVGHNTTWLGFVSQGGLSNFIFTVGSCSTNQGLQIGIWGDCACGEEVLCISIPCTPPNTVTSAQINLIPNKVYYLFLDGCSGDICDFTINTSGGNIPTLDPLGYINNIANKIIEPVCRGACYHFFVNPETNSANVFYTWSMNGAKYNSSNEMVFDFPDEGDFTICVSKFIGNPNARSICSLVGPQCATVKVRAKIDTLFGSKRFLCREETIPDGYLWHSQKIINSGIYLEHLNNVNCCEVDSVVEFELLNAPIPSQVYFISCSNEAYIDVLGREHFPCKDSFEIVLPKFSVANHCDSAIILTAVSVDFSADWKVNCMNQEIELASNLRITNPCNAGEAYSYKYKWYKKNDPNKNVLSTDEYLHVQKLNEEYCLDVELTVDLQTQRKVCTKTFCESIDEGSFAKLAGRDFKQKEIIAKLNANPGWSGVWKLISGPGNVIFEKSTNPKSRVRVDQYGLYCFEWATNDINCASKDTVCVEFYKLKTTTPDSPKKIFDDRNAFLNEEEYFSNEFFTPNLISNTGTSFISLDGEVNKELSYHWFDIYGKSILNGSILVEPRVQRMNFNSPLQQGFYFLVIEMDGVPSVRKVCVIE